MALVRRIGRATAGKGEHEGWEGREDCSFNSNSKVNPSNMKSMKIHEGGMKKDDCR